MSFWRQLWVLVQGALMVALAAALAFLIYGLGIPGVMASPAGLEDKRDSLQSRLETLQHENEMLRRFALEPDRGPREMKTLQQQRAIQRKIVPDEPALESFQAAVKKDAAAAGVRLVAFPDAKPIAHDYYTEETIKAELEGSYDTVQAFFSRIQREERIIVVSGVLVTSPAPPYTPQHRIALGAPVHVACRVTTFYRHDPQASPPTHR